MRTISAIAGIFMLLGSVVYSSPLNVKINNQSGILDDKIYVMIVGKDSTAQNFRIFRGPETLGSIKATGLITLQKIVSGRIYISYNFNLPTNNPGYINPADPDLENIRYDWVELTYDPNDKNSCVNLTSVDQLGIALSISNDKNKTRGYKKSIEDIVKDMKNNLTINSDSENPFKGSFIANNFIRVLSPLKLPKSYIFFNAYLTNLNNHKITIKDVFSKAGDPLNGKIVDYTGQIVTGAIDFLSNNPGFNNIYLTSDSISAEHLADCNGIFYHDPNRQSDNFGNNDYYCVVYRDFLAGVNMGYWGAVMPNGQKVASNQDWYDVQPFANGGNLYAKEIYKASNSYGFSFSDVEKRIKTLLELNPAGDTLTINILGDQMTNGYTPINQAVVKPIASGNTSIQFNFFFPSPDANMNFVFNGNTYTVPSTNGPMVQISAAPANKNTTNKYPVSYKGLNDVLEVSLDNNGFIIDKTKVKWETGCITPASPQPSIAPSLPVVNAGGF